MQREFEMQQADANEFDLHAKHLGVAHEHYQRTALIVGPTMANSSVQQLTEDIRDSYQLIRCVWFPGEMPASRARLKTIFDLSYFGTLDARAQGRNELVVELRKPRYSQARDKEDRIKFYRDPSGLWIMRYGKFDHRNFDLYNFHGVSLPETGFLAAIKPEISD